MLTNKGGGGGGLETQERKTIADRKRMRLFSDIALTLRLSIATFPILHTHLVHSYSLGPDISPGRYFHWWVPRNSVGHD